MAPKSIVIKKYENRRLYDTTNRRYINLNEIALMVREGHKVTVVDAASGEDLTRLILTQIVVEDAKTPDSVFPIEILRQMIVVSGQATQESASRYTKMMMEIYRNVFQTVPPALNPFNFMPPWLKASMPETGPPVPEDLASEPPTRMQEQPDPPPESSGEVEALRRRVEQLEVQGLRRAKKKKTKPAASKPVSKKR